MSDFLTRLGDRVNPIVVKEMRQAVNSRLVSVTLFIFLAIQLTAMTLQLTTRNLGSNFDDESLRIGRTVFEFVQAILVGTCILIIPIMSWVRLAGERSDANVDLMFISSLSPRQIMAGKFLASTALALLIFSSCAPFMTFAYVLRGLDIPTILIILGIDFLAVQLTTMFALFMASIPATRGFRVFIGIASLIVLIYAMSGIMALTTEGVRYGFSTDLDRAYFWLRALGITGFVVAVIGWLFVMATALLSPATANRALPVRLYLLGFWLLSAIGFGVWSLEMGTTEPFEIWGVIWSILFSLQLMISISERDKLGPRVARRIPVRRITRTTALFFYSGATGGVFFATLCGGITLASIWLWSSYVEDLSRAIRPHRDDQLYLASFLFGYTYCFSMSAIVFRRLLKRTSFQPSLTWLVALILFGIASILPHIGRVMFFDTRYSYGITEEVVWLYLPSPVVMIDLSESQPLMSNWKTSFFLIVWGALATLLNLSWLIQQVHAFRPPMLPPAKNFGNG